MKGRIGHNNIGKDEHDTEAVWRIGATTVAEFVALRNSDMLVGFLSNFPKRAGQGAVCPQRWYELRSRERPDDVREHVREMDAILRNTKTDDFIPSEPRTLALHMPEGHPCLDADDPVHDCACFYKIALGGDLITEERLRREGRNQNEEEEQCAEEKKGLEKEKKTEKDELNGGLSCRGVVYRVARQMSETPKRRRRKTEASTKARWKAPKGNRKRNGIGKVRRRSWSQD